jgi:large subunit ribosomal protein L17
MRHRVTTKRMNMDMSHRTSLLKNLSKSLILNGSIETTLAKAKFVKPYVEKLVTKAKRGSDIVNLNRVNAKLGSKKALRMLFEDIAVGFLDRQGGYTKITKLGFRKGDRAEMARIEWSDRKPVKETEATEPKKKTKVTKESKENEEK